MMPSELPQGRYLSLAFRVATDSGGQTRALLMRNRILATEGGVRPDVLTLGPAPDYEQRRELLREQGQLVDGVGLLNIYEHFREHGWGDEAPTGRTLEDLSAHRLREEPGPGGTPWRVIHRFPGVDRPIIDYLRADGTTYLRMPAFSLNYKAWWRGPILMVGEDGAILGEYETPGNWFRRWIRDLVGEREKAFVFMDSRFVVPHVAPMRGRRFHLIYLMHNLHVGPPRRWDSEVSPVYKRALSRIGGLDAMVTLTERQRDDIAERQGRTTNLFVVPNPVTMPQPPETEAPRDPHRVTIVARLEPQKRLGDAIAAFRLVVDAVPGARLDIFGDGSKGSELEAEIERLRAHGLGRAPRLRPGGARGALDFERVPDDERVRGLSAVDAREHEPRLPRRQLRHQVRPARADHRRRRRLPRSRGRHRAAGPAGDRAAAVARARAADERRPRASGPRATGRPSSWPPGRASYRRRSSTSRCERSSRAWTSSSAGCGS